MLRELKSILKGREQVSFDEICSRLNQDKEVIEHGLHLLIQKGLVAEVKQELPCSSCSCGGSCRVMEERIYRLVT